MEHRFLVEMIFFSGFSLSGFVQLTIPLRVEFKRPERKNLDVGHIMQLDRHITTNLQNEIGKKINFSYVWVWQYDFDSCKLTLITVNQRIQMPTIQQPKK